MSTIKKTKNSGERGAAMLIAIIFFLFISTTIVFGVVTPILKQVRISKDLIDSKESYFLAEGALEDALYRVKTGKIISSGETLIVNGYTTTITLTTTSNGKTISALSNRDGVIRKMESKVTAGIGAVFYYGIQTGVGGFSLSGNATVNGNVYSNGPITSDSGNTAITGTAISANGPALASDQSNGSSTPPYDITFGNAGGTQDFAQSFQVSNTGTVNKVQLYLKKVGTPSNLTVRITSNNNGSPNNSSLATGALGASLVSTSYGWVDVPFSTNPELTASTTYWIVIDGPTSSSNNYRIGGNSNGYANGTGKIGAYNGTWNATTPSGLDGYFSLYLGGVTGIITGLEVGTGTTGDAKANTVNNSIVRGGLYCQTGTGNNKACNTSLPDPTPTAMPVSDQNILDWKDEAAAGGTYSGNYSLANNSTASLGPKEITGNLVLDGNSVLTVTGTLWVHGNITVSSNALIRLSASYGESSGAIIADGNINFSTNIGIEGSGQTGSYILLLTTSTCPVGSSCGGGITKAITVGGNGGAVILNAQNGTISFTGNAHANQVTAKTISIEGNTTITYLSGLADTNFSSGPGGGWDISSWKEVQ